MTVPITQNNIAFNQRIAPTGGPLVGAQVTRNISKQIEQKRDSFVAQANENAYLQGQSILTDELTRIEEQNKNDPDAMKEAIEGFSETFLKEVSDEEMALRFGLQIDTAANSAITRAKNKRKALVNDQQRLLSLQSAQQLQNKAPSVLKDMTSADPETALAAAKEFQEMVMRGTSIYSQRDQDGSFLFTPAQQVSAMQDIKDKALLGAIQDNPQLFSKFEDGTLEFEFPNGDGVDRINVRDAMSPQYQNFVNKEIERQRAIQEAKSRAELDSGIQALEGSILLGAEFPEQSALELEQQAINAGLEKRAQEIRDMRDMYTQTQKYVNMPLQQQLQTRDSLISSLSENPDPKQVRVAQAVSKILDNKLSQLQSDPVKYYQSTGQVSTFDPINIADAQGSIANIEQRRLEVGAIAKKDGVRLPLITERETENMTQLFERGNTQQRTALLSNIGQVFRQDEAQLIAKKLAKNNTTVAAATAVVHETPVTAQRILEGSQREKLISKGEMVVSIQSKLAGAVPDVRVLNDITDAAHALYTQYAFEANDTTKVIAPERVDKVIGDLVGPPVSLKNGSKVLPFRIDNGQWIEKGQFERALDQVDNNVLEQTQGSGFFDNQGRQLDAQDVLDYATLETVGDGRYLVRIGDAYVVQRQDGTNYEIDMKTILPNVDSRSMFGKFLDGINTPLERKLGDDE